MRTTTIFFAVLAGMFTSGLMAQCYNAGSTPIAGQWTLSPVALGCNAAPNWPMWHLFTPPHRAPSAHVGFNPGNAHSLPQVLIAYRCTGFALVPVIPYRVRTMGYVIDRAEHPCIIE